MNEISRIEPSAAQGDIPRSSSVLRESAETAQVAAALVRAIGKMTNPPRNRSVEVSTRGGGKYGFRYATLDKILDMARPVLAEEKLALFQPLTTNEKGAAVLATRLLHESGEWMETCLPLPPPGGDPQSFGSAVTYLRRYAVTALLGIASDEDTDAAQTKGNTIRDVTPRHERLRDEAGRSANPLDALTNRAKGARTVDDGTDLLRAWAGEASAIEAMRGRPEWEVLLRHVGVGLRNSLGQTCASAFVRAARMTGPEDVAAFEETWGGEWSDSLLKMQEEAPENYRALQGHVVRNRRRAQACVGGERQPAGAVISKGSDADKKETATVAEEKPKTPEDGPMALVLISADGAVEQFETIVEWEKAAMEQIAKLTTRQDQANWRSNNRRDFERMAQAHPEPVRRVRSAFLRLCDKTAADRPEPVA